jgi:hypothetical protein
MADGKYAKYVFSGLKPMEESQGTTVPISKAAGIHNMFIWDVWSHKFQESKIWVEANLIQGAGVFLGQNQPLVSAVAGQTGMGFCNEVGQELIRLGCHAHTADEVFFLFGTDPDKLGQLGGEYEFWLGAGDQAEKYMFTENTCVYVPAGLVHNPNGATRIDDPSHPIGFFAVMLATTHMPETTSYPTDKDGNLIWPPAFVEEHGLY